MKKIIHLIFYGNIFLGICAVALCIESNLLNHISLNVFPFYLLIFFCTCIYYTMIYVRSVRTKNYDDRTLWYRANLDKIKVTLKGAIAVTVAFILFLVWQNFQKLLLLSPLQIGLIFAFPLIAGWYTFTPPIFNIRQIRQIGWIKPFVVGFTWSGWVTIYPILIWQVQRVHIDSSPVFPSFLLWLQNFLYLSVIAMLFDIKDFRTDVKHQLKTYPVILGIKRTFRYIIIPALMVNMAVFFFYQWQQQNQLMQTVLQLIPYLLLVYIIIKHQQQKSVLYYLVAIDGLLFVKAVCGITSIYIF